MSSRLSLGLATAAAALAIGAAPAAAQNTCGQDVSPTYTDRCGPSFVLPTWGDGGGWTQPDQYETIQLADVDGDGDDELLARTPAGVAIHDFDKTFGQWRPQTTPVPSPTNPNDVRYRPAVLTPLANRAPLTTANPEPAGTDWTLPQYYDTIQAANIDSHPGAEVIARSAAGVIVFKFTPGAAPGQGSWRQLTTSGPLPDSDHWDEPSYYSTMQTGDFDGDGDHELFARGSDDIAVLDWTGSSWKELASVNFLQDAAGGSEPAYYTSLQAANLTGDRQALVGRDEGGISAYRLGRGGWILADQFSMPFGDDQGLDDCPFVASGSACFGTGPAYYGTIQFADLDGNGRDELLGRASDGLRVRRYQGDTSDGWSRLPTLTDLSDAGGYTAQKYWETIQTGDIDGDGRAEVLARGGNGLNAWSYNPASRSWTKLSPSTQLALADDPWGSDRSYYSTIQTGDVDGDKRDDVVARGPYGIRTWFYNRRGTGGWERYLPEGYTDFPSRTCTGGATAPCGEQGAYAALNARAQSSIPGGGPTVRSVWTGQNPPARSDLTDLQNAVLQVAGCTNKTQSNPDQYGACTPNPASTSFTNAEWTAVVNELLAEIYWAEQVWSHFYDSAAGIQKLWSIVTTEQLSQLPAIRNQLRLAGPDQTTVDYNPGEYWSVAFGMAGAIAALIPGADLVVPPLWMASELTSLIPSSTTDLLAPFESTYANLEEEFANGLTKADAALATHSAIVRGDERLLTLVGQLRFHGTWELDANGMGSAARQGFATWLYKSLLPTIWARYVVTDCVDRGYPDAQRCAGPAPGVWVQGKAPSFTAIGPKPALPQGYPCTIAGSSDPNGSYWECTYVAPPSNVASILWGQVAQGCAYNGQANTVWTFPDPTKGGCALGVDPRETLSDPATLAASRRWSFPTYSGDPEIHSALAGSVRKIAGPRGSGLSGPRGAEAMVRLRATVAVPRRLRMRRARIVLGRVLLDRGGAGELVRHRSGRKLPPVRLARLAARRSTGVFASRGRRGPRARLRLRARGKRLSLRLALRNVRLPRAPALCSGTRPGVDLAVDAIPLHTRLRILDGRRPLAISLPLRWRCRRDRVGAVSRLVVQPPVTGRPRGKKPALAIGGPRRRAAGRRATYTIRFRNRRRTTAHDVLVRASLSRGMRPRRVRGGRVRGGLVIWRWPALRAGRSRRVRLPVRFGRFAARPVCLTVVVSAIDTRPAKRRVCPRSVRR